MKVLSYKSFIQNNEFRGIYLLKPVKRQSYKMPTEVIFGRNSLLTLPDLPVIKKSRRVIYVVGEHLKESKVVKGIFSGLHDGSSETILYKNPIKKSTFVEINKLVDFVKLIAPEVLVAIGGGTVLDVVKCAAVLASNIGPTQDYITGAKILSNPGIPVVAVPTTAGTGSEVTPWAVIWDYKRRKKYSLASPFMFPKIAVVDSSLTDSLSARITAETGFDALTQAVEAFWSVKHNPISDELAIAAVKLLIANLPQAVINPNILTRDKIMKASLITGLAFSNTQTTLCHSVSYPLTARFGITHGQAVAITLPVFFEYIVSDYDKKRKDWLLSAIGAENVLSARKFLSELMKTAGLKNKLSDLGIKKRDLNIIVEEGFDRQRARNSPKIPTPDELERLLYSII